MVERRFNEELGRHEENEYAHPKARHRLTNDWIDRFQIPIERRLATVERTVEEIQEQMNDTALAAATAAGEARANRQLLRFFGTMISVLVSAFGVAILVKLGML